MDKYFYKTNGKPLKFKYYYKGKLRSKKESLAKKYIQYLKSKQGYTSVSSDDDYGFVTLANDDWGVIVDTTQSDAVNILPYHRSY